MKPSADSALDVTFRRVTLADLPLLDGWLRQPHLQEWWGDPDEEVGYIRDMLDGRDSTEPYLFLLNDAPAGYIQIWHCDDARVEPWLSKAPWLRHLPRGCVGVDLSIGDGAQLSKGTGSHVLRAFVDGLYARGFDDIIIDPDRTNARAIRAYEKAGFVAIPELAGKGGTYLIMRHRRVTG